MTDGRSDGTSPGEIVGMSGIINDGKGEVVGSGESVGLFVGGFVAVGDPVIDGDVDGLLLGLGVGIDSIVPSGVGMLVASVKIGASVGGASDGVGASLGSSRKLTTNREYKKADPTATLLTKTTETSRIVPIAGFGTFIVPVTIVFSSLLLCVIPTIGNSHTGATFVINVSPGSNKLVVSSV